MLHVVGFDVGGKAEEQLKCMAKAGGGKYFPVKDADKLKHALDTVVDKTLAENLVITAFDDKNAPVSAWVNVMDRSGKIIDSDGGKRVRFALAPGNYTLTVKPETMTETKTLEDVTVTRRSGCAPQSGFRQIPDHRDHKGLGRGTSAHNRANSGGLATARRRFATFGRGKMEKAYYNGFGGAVET